METLQKQQGGGEAGWTAALGGTLGMCLLACVGCFGRSSVEPRGPSSTAAGSASSSGGTGAYPYSSYGGGGAYSYSYKPRIPQPRKPVCVFSRRHSKSIIPFRLASD